ncbi:MAG TPA: two-component regulator propeller domain-containing protein, partial [Candidatus Deferrimicrobiaceae bacterium]
MPAPPASGVAPSLSTEGGKYPYAAAYLVKTRTAVLPRAIPSSGAVRPLVLAIDFATRAASPVAYRPLLGDRFYGAGPSLANYWAEASVGRLTLSGNVTDINPGVIAPVASGWLTASPSVSNNAGTFVSAVNDPNSIQGVDVANVTTLLRAAISYLDNTSFANVQFANYRRSATDNTITVIIVHPGYGQEDSGNTSDPYSHSAPFTPPIRTRDGSIVTDYMLVPSLQFYNDTEDNHGPAGWVTNLANDRLIGVGVIAHEMGHLLGLPDLYPTAQNTQGQVQADFSGVGVFDLMGYGMWGSPISAGRRAGTLLPAGSPPGTESPSHLSAWSRIELGWLVPEIVSRTQANLPLPAAETSLRAAKIYPNGPGDESQFFLLENRRPGVPGTQFDGGLPGSGMLVWRVDNFRMNQWRVSQANPLLRIPANNGDNTASYPHLALSVMEADLPDTVNFYLSPFFPHLVRPLPAESITAANAFLFGSPGDFFGAGRIFDRNGPGVTADLGSVVPRVGGANVTNTAPWTLHGVFDAGWRLVLEFVTDALSSIYNFTAELPFWKNFSVDVDPAVPLRHVLSFGFDNAGRTWVGTGDDGIWIYPIGAWKHLTLPLPARVQALAYEGGKGVMWVGTSNALERVEGDRFLTPSISAPGGINVQSMLIDRAGKKWVVSGPLAGVLPGLIGGANLNVVYETTTGTQNLLPNLNLRMFRIGQATGGLEGGEVITCLAFDNNVVSQVPTDPIRFKDLLYLGTSKGRVFRNAPSDNSMLISSLYNDPALFDTQLRFDEMAMPTPSPNYIYGMTVDRNGTLWISTDRGLLPCDRGEGFRGNIPGINYNRGTSYFNPFDMFGNGWDPGHTTANDNLVGNGRGQGNPGYLGLPVDIYSGGIVTTNGIVPTGVTLQQPDLLSDVIWVSHGAPNDNAEVGGGAERIDVSAMTNNAIPRVAGWHEHARTVFTQSLTIPRGPGIVKSPTVAISDLICAAGDGGFNVWFGTKKSGAIRFGSGAALTLDRALYLNAEAVAVVKVSDENVPGDVSVLSVTVSSSASTPITVPVT